MALAPNMRQTITWTNYDPVHWRIYAARGELIVALWRQNGVVNIDF